MYVNILDIFFKYHFYLSIIGVTEETITERTTDAVNGTTSINEETIAGFKVEDILNVVSKTADQGITIISNWFGISSEDEKLNSEVVESKTSDIQNATNPA